MVQGIVERPDSSEYAPAFAGYVSLVPETDVMASLARQKGELVEALSPVRGEAERYRYANGKWTVREVVGHVIDSERVFGYRALCIARGETASLPGFDENTYAANAPYGDYPLGDLLEEFAQVREGHLSLFRHLSREAWLRVGLANSNAVSVRAMAFIIVGHVRHHLGILSQRYLPHVRP
ncbi:MAG: DinB family protein [Vicinamibacteria bacterium]